MPFAQRLLQRRVQFGRIDVAIVEVALDERRIDFDHLLDQRTVRRVDGAEVAVAFAVVETIHHPGTAAVGQVQRQALFAEGRLDLLQQAGQIDFLRIDLVDDDHAIEVARGGVLHHALRHRLDAGGRVDHDHRRFHRFERGQRLTHEVG